MKKLIIGVLGIVAAGCVTRPGVVVENGAIEHPNMVTVSAKHAHLKSVLGINDTILADTNRFLSGQCGYSQEFKLDSPFGGFTDVNVFLDKMTDSSRNTTDGKPHRLRGVFLKRRLPDETADKEVVAEWQAACDFVADLLDVEAPKVKLVDIGKWRRSLHGIHGLGNIDSSMTFNLADNQSIDVDLNEPLYVLRNGKMALISPGHVMISVTFNRDLFPTAVRMTDDEGKPEIEVDFGPDCRDKLAEALKRESDKRAKRARRKSAKNGL